MIAVLKKRQALREHYLQLALEYVQSLESELSITAAAVIGSVARGDFNDASDIDVIIISEDLPQDPLERSAVLYENVPPLVEPKAYTKDEFRKMLSKRNPIALATLSEGVMLIDKERLLEQKERLPVQEDSM
ncbi:MAG: nucleotidyltransferase domain-containing protein [Firmicutes bacterium]|jgi:predicted nucleotidyltransferase|nr:nucleotidyltransferase domain-containing protein [Bacillota bacterium]